MLKRTLGWAGPCLAAAVLFAGCQDPGSGAGPPPPPKSPSSVGSATISWEAPTTNTNGTALTDLTGYRIYYGSSPTHLDHSVNIGTIGLQTYVIENLGPGTWYFAVMAVAANGAQSGFSNIAVKTVT